MITDIGAYLNIASKQIEWVLDKATPYITLSKELISLDSDNLTDTFTITTNSDGNLFASSSDDSIVTVSLSGNTATVTALANGTCMITVSVTESTDDNYLSGSKELSVTCDLLSTTLNDNSWKTISQVAKVGDGDLYWDIGDCKEITLSGKVGDHLTISNTKLCVFILDFNHKMNGVAENNIIFGGFKTTLTGGIDVALADDKYQTNSNDGTIRFNMNHWGNKNYGGWKGSDFRYDILGATSTPPSDYGKAHTTSCVGYDATSDILTSPKANTMLAALPSDLRSNMRLWTRWIDAVGNNSDVDVNIQTTVDAITLLNEPEILTSRFYANKYEYNHNTRMAYYANGNGTIKKSHKDGSTAVQWWESSPYYRSEYNFCIVYTGGDPTINTSSNSYALAPAFKI